MQYQDDYDEMSLLALMKNEDKDAFIQIYNHYRKPLHSFIIRFVKVPAHAEDILQEVFLKLWEIRTRVNPQLGFKAYLYRITRNIVYKFLKKCAIDQMLQAQIIHHIQPENNQLQLQLEWEEYKEKIDAAILQLPPKRQKVFLLCREQNKSYDTVAMELNISRNTVKEHMVLAMKSIETYLKTNSGISLPLLLSVFFG